MFQFQILTTKHHDQQMKMFERILMTKTHDDLSIYSLFATVTCQIVVIQTDFLFVQNISVEQKIKLISDELKNEDNICCADDMMYLCVFQNSGIIRSKNSATTKLLLDIQYPMMFIKQNILSLKFFLKCTCPMKIFYI